MRSTHKLTKVQRHVIERMAQGWELAFPHDYWNRGNGALTRFTEAEDVRHAVLDKLAAAGLVTRTESDDRFLRRYALTEEGRAIAEAGHA